MRCNDYVRIMMMVDSENSEFFVYLHFDTAGKEKNIFNRVIGMYIMYIYLLAALDFGMENEIHLCKKSCVMVAMLFVSQSHD